MRRTAAAVAVTVAVGLLPAAGCTSGAAGGPGGSPPAAQRQTSGTRPPAAAAVRVAGTVAERLPVPWGVAFLPDGSALVAERGTGEVVRLAAGGRRSPAGRVPGVAAEGEGGLLGLAVPPHAGARPWVYAYLTTAADNRIVRMRWDGRRLGPPRTVLAGIPRGTFHDGGRIAFGPDGYLYAGTGETGRRPLAQDRASLGGKILRITADGRPAPGNPFPGSPVYSLGHRNVQGLAWDSRGRLWATEFGQDTWDELNLVRPGGNYGWPVVEGRAHRAGFTDPVVQWRPAEASPSGLAYWHGALWVAALRGRRLWRVPLRGDGTAGTPQAELTGVYGRLRTVAAAPDGSLWVVTGNTDGRGEPAPQDDRVLRLTAP
ncbi:PQQ-dependent sugar dehydrogenase [Streptacidiphilus sp. ASG 303]|uniref:PQQ-dependent sugar dehydrogenase n=1 Tax=Streptacidiphilus sp. ASG 303 TaxID=2896847 RepID=UPI001E35A03E|nr:PQQ-dependent sugar dehydrogenase [Streptacidiphilus sp. ASG 303]MCD0483053.1 PQQ-dependent sugar dehydrogenase [Streptacidiphilus sp. ASG 303]